MSDNLFKRVAYITDLHFGRSGNSPTANQDNIDFLEWAIDHARTWGAETMVMSGDWHDNRHSLGVSTIDYSLTGLDMVNAGFKRTFFLCGNHDLLHREKRDVTSIAFARYLPNIEIIRNPTDMGGVTMLPWLVGEEHKTIKDLKSRYVFAHLEMPGFLMNAKVEMPDSPHLVKPDQFKGVETVFTGHFHMRQQQGRVIYTGNIMPFNFSDAGDGERGLMLLEWGGDPIFERWPGQPLYSHAKLTDILEHPHRILRPKMTVRATVDMTIGFDEAQDIRDTLVKEYGLRKVELTQQAREGDEGPQQMDEGVVFKSVDQMVIDGLLSIDSPTLSKERLVAIYRALAD